MARSVTLRLILGDQLNERHPWFAKKNDDVLYVMMEVRQETDYVKHHIQKVAAFFAAMRAFANQLEKKGHRVVYLKLDDGDNRQAIPDNIRRLLKKHRCRRFEYLLPDEYRLDRQLRQLSGELGVDTSAVDTEHFLAKREELAEFFSGKKRFLMESFYREMRRRYGILMDASNNPRGGKWNYDQKNREAYDGRAKIPKPLCFENDVRELVQVIRGAGVETFGAIDAERLIWPVNRRQALKLLRHFVDRCLAHFGTYQDAMTTESWSVFHSRLSFALNTKMLHPMEVMRKALAAWENASKNVGIHQIEGFVRQILGWREYMRGMYWMMMPDFATMNFFDHRGPLPDYYWSGETRMRCMRAAIGQSLEHAYAHHIQRLMVTGNFALLAGIDPDAVEAWYLGVYIDAVQWVEMPNTRAMSQFADGGRVATKPYVSSARYIQSMSDYCSDCTYDYRKRAGEGACPFNCLYWDFFERHRKKLASIPRIGMMYRTWDRMADKRKKRILKQAEDYRGHLNRL
jgi:deoxyribodipyrimidine photolyase-related protein